MFAADQEHNISKFFRKAFIKTANDGRAKNDEPELTEDEEDIIEENINDLLNLGIYSLPTLKISSKAQLIDDGKKSVVRVVNDTMITLYWNIGKTINDDILCGDRASYGDAIIEELSNRLLLKFGNGFNKTSLFRMLNFYQKFPDFEIVATLSQQLTWSYFVELLPIKEALKRDFYATMCKNERWSVRTLRERKKSMLYERIAISK